MPKMKNDKMYIRLRNAPEAKPAKPKKAEGASSV